MSKQDDAVASIMKTTGLSKEQAEAIASEIGQSDHEQTSSGEDQNWEYNGYAAHWSPND